MLLDLFTIIISKKMREKKTFVDIIGSFIRVIRTEDWEFMY